MPTLFIIDPTENDNDNRAHAMIKHSVVLINVMHDM